MQWIDPLATELRGWLDGAPPRLLLLEARPGAHARRRISAALDVARWLRPHPGGGEASLAAFAGALDVESEGDPAGDPDWEAFWSRWVEAAARRPAVPWIIDDAGSLPAAAWRALVNGWARVRGQAAPVRLVLVVGPGDTHDRLDGLPHDRLSAAPPPAWRWVDRLPGWSAPDRIRAASIFGAQERFAHLLDPSRSLGRNVRSAVLSPDSALASEPLERLRTAVQRPERYLRILEALATGATEWGEIRRGVGGLTTSGQLGPYLRTLEELGLVEGARSLDASPRTRARRYRIVDPWVAFWFACVLPAWHRLGVVDSRTLWSEVSGRLDVHVERTLPTLVREWLRTSATLPHLRSTAREVGGLWGEGYEIDVAGTLMNGAIVYGWTRWAREGFDRGEVALRREQLRRTRYGFGRERRLRLFVQRDPPDHDLTRVDARDPDVLVLSVRDLVEAPTA